MRAPSKEHRVAVNPLQQVCRLESLMLLEATQVINLGDVVIYMHNIGRTKSIATAVGKYCIFYRVQDWRVRLFAS